MNRVNTPLPALLFALLASCGNIDEPAATPESEAHGLGIIAQKNLETHLVWLADDAREGRVAGQPGHAAAAKYVADYFADVGVGPGGDEGFYQQVPLVSYMIDTESTSVVVHRDREDRELAYRDDYACRSSRSAAMTARC